MPLSFLDHLRGFADAEAFRSSEVSCLYGDLVRMTSDWSSLLDDQDVGPGAVVMLSGVCSPSTMSAFLALAGRGAIVVPHTPVAGSDRASEIGVAEVENVLEVGADGRSECLHTGHRAQNDLYTALRADARPGLVLFSSGTSGAKKATVLDLSRILAHYPGHGTPRPRRVLLFLNMDHIGGVNTMLHTLSHGGTVVTVPDRSPDTVFRVISECGVQVLPTTPTFINMMLVTGAHTRFPSGSLELITYGTEPMPPRTLRLLHEALPHVRLKQTYGLSELGILPTKSQADASGWMKLGGAGFEHKIVDGLLWIRSDLAMLGYLNAPAEFDEEGFFNTQDEVEVDGEYLRVLGRRSDIVNVGGEKVYPAEVENVILEMPNVRDVVVSGHPSPITGMVVRATVQLLVDEDERTVRQQVRDHCRDRLERYKIPVLVTVAKNGMHSERFKKTRTPRRD